MKASEIRQNAAKKMYVPHPITVNMSGVTRPMMKLLIHVVLVVMAMDLERLVRLKISDGNAHLIGAIE